MAEEDLASVVVVGGTYKRKGKVLTFPITLRAKGTIQHILPDIPKSEVFIIIPMTGSLIPSYLLGVIMWLY